MYVVPTTYYFSTYDTYTNSSMITTPVMVLRMVWLVERLVTNSPVAHDQTSLGLSFIICM